MLLLTLLEAPGFWAFAETAGAMRTSETARHRKSAECGWDDDLVKKDTIGFDAPMKFKGAKGGVAT